MPRVPSTISAQGTSQTPAARVSPPVAVLPRQITGDRQTQAMQANAEAATRGARSLPIGNGNLIKGLAFVANTPLVVSHRLGAKWSGYIVTKCSAAARFWFVAQSSSLDARQVTLEADANVTADVWVFQ